MTLERYWSGGLHDKEDDTSPTVDIFVDGSQLAIGIVGNDGRVAHLNLSRADAIKIVNLLHEAVSHSDDWLIRGGAK